MTISLIVLAYLVVGLLLSRHWTRKHLASPCPGSIDRLPNGFARREGKLRTWLEYYQDPCVYKGQRDVYFDAVVRAVLWPLVLVFRIVSWSFSGLFLAPAEAALKRAREQDKERQETIDYWAKLSTSDDEWVRDQAVKMLEILGAHKIEPVKDLPEWAQRLIPADREEYKAARELGAELRRKAGPHYGEGGAW